MLFSRFPYILSGKFILTKSSLVKAKIIRRPSLTIKSPYVATIILINDESETHYLAHCPSLGCSGLCETGCTVFVSKKSQWIVFPWENTSNSKSDRKEYITKRGLS